MTDREPVEIDGVTGEVDELPPKHFRRYRAELNTAQDVKREMAKVYRECRSNLIDAQTGTKLVWMLQSIAKVIESSDLEQRVERLENVSITQSN